MLKLLHIFGVYATCLDVLLSQCITGFNILLRMFTSMLMREVLCSFLLRKISILLLQQSNIGFKKYVGCVPSLVLSGTVSIELI